MKNLRKFNELYINRDEPTSPFHKSDEPKKWGEKERFVPQPSSKPYLVPSDDLESELSEMGLSVEDLNTFRSLLTKMRDMNRDIKSQEHVLTDMILFSRLLKANQPLVDKLMNLNK